VFPVPSSQPLSFPKIADYWSREMKPPTSRDELFDFLVKAWWRGDLLASGAERVDVLKAIHNNPPSWITFEDDQQIRELPNGVVEVRRFVPLPKSNPDSWTDDDCTEAFQVIAEIWDSSDFELFVPVVWGLQLREDEYTRWVKSCTHQRGSFWTKGKKEKGSSPKISKASVTDLAREYYDSAQSPTQDGFVKWLKAKKVAGSRDVFRSTYKDLAGQLRAGRPTKKGAIRRDKTENLQELNSPQIANNAPPDRNDP
jgi:hypothetical protein